MRVPCGGGSNDTPPAPPLPPATALSLLAGSTDGSGRQDGAGASAKISVETGGMALATKGDVLMADAGNNTIRELPPTGQLTTVASSPTRSDAISTETRYLDATGTTASFNAPLTVAVDAAGSACVADAGNQVARKIVASGNVTSLAGKVGVCGNANGTAATLCSPTSIAVDKGEDVYVSEWVPSTQGLPPEPTGNSIQILDPSALWYCATSYQIHRREWA